jgi:hypothetical protein
LSSLDKKGNSDHKDYPFLVSRRRREEGEEGGFS